MYIEKEKKKNDAQDIVRREQVCLLVLLNKICLISRQPAFISSGCILGRASQKACVCYKKNKNKKNLSNIPASPAWGSE